MEPEGRAKLGEVASTCRCRGDTPFEVAVPHSMSRLGRRPRTNAAISQRPWIGSFLAHIVRRETLQNGKASGPKTQGASASSDDQGEGSANRSPSCRTE